MSNAKNGLTKEGRSVFWRWYFLGGAGWNYEKMQGLGYYFSMLPMIKKQKDEVAHKIADAVAQREAHRIHPGDKVTLVEPSILPDAMVDPICEILAGAPGVGSAYLSVMIVNGEARSYLLVLDGPKDDKLFAAVAQAARPYLLSREKKMDLNITTSISPMGQQGMRGSEPFYRKGIGRVVEEDDDE